VSITRWHFLPKTLLAGVVAAFATLRRCAVGLRIDDGGARFSSTTHAGPPLLAQPILHALEGVDLNPSHEGFVDRLPRGEARWQESPGATRPQHVAAGVDQMPTLVARRRTAAAFGALEEIGDQAPFGIGQIGAVLASLTPVRCGVAVALGYGDRCYWLDVLSSHLPRWYRAHDALRTQCPVDGGSADLHSAEMTELGSKFIERRMRHPVNDLTQDEDVLRRQRRGSAASVDRFLAIARSVLRHRHLPHRSESPRLN
jgi:hypothetical protein